MNLLRILSSPGQDFRQLVEAAVLVITQLVNPYQHLLTSPGPYNYPPPSFLLFIPFGYVELFLGQQVAWYLWVFLSLAALIFGIWLLLRITKRDSWSGLLFSIVIFWFLFFPTKYNLGMGQVNTYIFLLVVLGIYYVSPFFLALAAAIKLSPVVLILYFILRRDFKRTAQYFLWLGVFFMIPFLFVSWDWQQQYYFRVFFNAFPLSGKDIYYNQSLLGFLTRSLDNPFIIRVFQYSISALLVLLTVLRAKKLTSTHLWSALVCLFLIINPLSWQHHFVLAIIPLMFLSGGGWLIIAYILIAANIASPGIFPKEFSFILSHQFFGVLILWLLALYEKKIRQILGSLWVMGIGAAYVLFIYTSRFGRY